MGLKSRDSFITMTYFNSVGWLLLLLHNLQSPVQTEYNRNKVIDVKFTPIHNLFLKTSFKQINNLNLQKRCLYGSFSYTM